MKQRTFAVMETFPVNSDMRPNNKERSVKIFNNSVQGGL